MTPEDRIQELLERWDDRRKLGDELSAEELCHDCPQLLEEVRKRIEALKATNWLEKPPGNDDNSFPYGHGGCAMPVLPRPASPEPLPSDPDE